MQAAPIIWIRSYLALTCYCT